MCIHNGGWLLVIGYRSVCQSVSMMKGLTQLPFFYLPEESAKRNLELCALCFVRKAYLLSYVRGNGLVSDTMPYLYGTIRVMRFLVSR